MLFPRLITAIVGLPLLIAAIYFGGVPFFFLILGVVFLGIREFYYLAEESGYPSFRWIGALVGLLVVVSVFLNGTAFGQVTENQSTAALLALLVIALAVRSIAQGPSETLLSEWGVTFFGVFYVAWSLAHLLLIRTSGEMRISNFLLWQLAYTEIYITPTPWPEFRRPHLYQALLDYQRRERRFGGL